MNRRLRPLALALSALVLTAPPAPAQTVIDGSERAIPREDLAKLLSIVAAQGGARAELRELRRASTVTSVMYCGRLRLPGSAAFAPLLVNVTAGIAYALTDNVPASERDFVRGRLGVFGCL